MTTTRTHGNSILHRWLQERLGNHTGSMLEWGFGGLTFNRHTHAWIATQRELELQDFLNIDAHAKPPYVLNLKPMGTATAAGQGHSADQLVKNATLMEELARNYVDVIATTPAARDLIQQRTGWCPAHVTYFRDITPNLRKRRDELPAITAIQRNTAAVRAQKTVWLKTDAEIIVVLAS